MESLMFRTSSLCSPWTCPNCVEVAESSTRIWYVRDSKDREGTVFAVDAGGWESFLSLVKSLDINK